MERPEMNTNLCKATSDVNNCEFEVQNKKKSEITPCAEVKNECEDVNNGSIKAEIKTETYEDMLIDDGNIAHIDSLNSSVNDHLKTEDTSNLAAHSVTRNISDKGIDAKPLEKICSLRTMKEIDINDGHILTPTVEKPFSCEFCSYKAKQNSQLKRHILTHTGEKPFSCDFCNFKTKYKYCLQAHILIHTGEKPFTCELCPYKARERSNLKRHFLTHTGEKRFSCEFCSYKSNENKSMKRHILNHTGEKPFPCEFCSYKTNNRAGLKKHILTHTRKKPFSCEFCSYKAMDMRNLDIHILIHTGEKRFLI